jgi:hypothetical protein
MTFTGVNGSATGGTVIYDARNDRWNNNPGFFDRMLFTFQLGVTAGGIENLAYVGTNTFSYWQQYGTEGQSNWAIFTNSADGLIFQNLIGLNDWSDSFITLSISQDSNPHGSDNNTVNNVYVQSGWVNGPALISGSNNTFNNIVGRNTCTDVEPNSLIEANFTTGNVFENITCIHDGTFASGYNAGSPSFGAGPPYYGFGFCGSGESNSCATTQTIENNNFYGALSVLSPCTSGGAQASTWTNNVGHSNNTGTPSCDCDSSCGTGY